MPGRISTNAPKSVIRWTFPRYVLFSSGLAVNSSMMVMAFWAASLSVEAMLTRPSSSTSIFTPVRSTMLRIVLPPGPMMSRILSTGMVIVTIRGAWVEMESRGAAMVACIFSSIARRPVRACASASRMTAVGTPAILMSICRAVMPFAEPATLKSMSP